MSKGGEPRSKSVGKCVTCGLVVRAGDETYDELDNLLHINCDEANKREIAMWKKEKEKRRLEICMKGRKRERELRRERGAESCCSN